MTKYWLFTTEYCFLLLLQFDFTSEISELNSLMDLVITGLREIGVQVLQKQLRLKM